jgi:hypothetical protein
LVVFEGERAQKQPAHIRRIETKYWAMHFKRHCRNSSPGCIKHEEKSECMHRWTRRTFPTINNNIGFCFLVSMLFIFWQIEHVSGMGCVAFRSPCVFTFLDRRQKPKTVNCRILWDFRSQWQQKEWRRNPVHTTTGLEARASW